MKVDCLHSVWCYANACLYALIAGMVSISSRRRAICISHHPGAKCMQHHATALGLLPVKLV